MTYGYARVSSKKQDKYGNSLEMQERQLSENGAEVIYKESFTGMKRYRPELDKLMSVLKEGDTLVVTKLDRIARSAKNGLEIIDELLARGVKINVLNMGKFDSSPAGKLMRTIFFAFAEFERDMIVERTTEGKEIARTRDNYKEGRREVDTQDLLEWQRKVECGAATVVEACSQMGISRGTWYNRVKAARI